MKTNHLSKLFLVAAFSAAFVACKRDNVDLDPALTSENNATSVNENGNAPSAHIAASENLEIPAAVAVPENLPNGNTRVATFYAVGVQKYKAQVVPGSNPEVYQWVFVAPQADLYDVTNGKVGTHAAGPHWTLSPNDSIFAQQFSPPKTAPSTDPESIDWLLLKPKNGTTPTGIFANVAYIQRIATKGGKAPATPPASASETVEVKYKAVYRFTKINP